MHDIEHQPAQEEPSSTPVQKGTTPAGRQKMPRAWRYTIIGISSVYAVRASDGAILWHYALNDGANSWAYWLSVENGIVYTSDAIPTNNTTGLGDIYALQSSNGSVLWRDKLHASLYSALLVHGVIYLGTSSGSLDSAVYAVRTGDGSLLWNYPIAGSMFAAPVLDGNTIYIGAGNGMAYALRADNGRVLWHYLTQVGGLFIVYHRVGAG